MGARDSRVDGYIEKAPDFAKPILAHVRELVHQGCPAVVETMKWSTPYFEHKGLLCGMAAFKKHCMFGFWKQDLLRDRVPGFSKKAAEILRRLCSPRDLPEDALLLRCIQEAARLNEAGVKLPAPKRSTPAKELVIPEALGAALKRNAEAAAVFENFSYSHKREYVEWIAEAKTEETRQRRAAKAIEQMTEGKSRHWKYQKG